MSLPLRGSDCVLRIGDPGTSSNFVLVEGVRLSGWKILQEQVEVTDGGDEGWRRLLPGAGLRSLELAFSGMYLGSIGEQLLRDKAFRGKPVECALTLDEGTAVRGRFIASSLSFEATVNDEATYAATLRSAGAVTID